MKNIAIRELAFFVYQKGNLSSDLSFNSDAKEGSIIHSLRQSEYGKEAIKEYYINHKLIIDKEEYNFIGFVDGLIEKDKRLVLEEIKTTDLNVYDENFQIKDEHLAQLKLYAYFLYLETNILDIELNLLYIERKTLKRRNYKYKVTSDELTNFFNETITIYLTYFNTINKIEIERLVTTNKLEFPFSIRDGQQEIIEATLTNFINNDILYILAPTGIGKTMATLYPAIKSMTKIGDKVFYLTAKNSGKASAIHALNILKESGLKIKSIELVAKKKICLYGKENCKMEECPYAKNFFEKLKEATLDILTNNDIIDNNILIDYAMKYEICSFEYALNISLYTSVIIADYNYVFDPKVKLIRYFEQDNFKPYLLVDEAHNLVSRSLEMYSNSLSIYTLIKLKNLFINEKIIYKKILVLINYLHKTYDDKVTTISSFISKDKDLNLENYLMDIVDEIYNYLEFNDSIDNKDEILEGYFELKDYLRIANLYDKTHLFIVKLENNNLIIRLKCLDASNYLLDTINNHSSGIVYFSATLYPLNYYKSFLSQNEGSYLELASPFNKDNLLLMNMPISTRYNDRHYTIDLIIDTIKKCIMAKQGHYIVFFPSYEYLNLIVSNINIDDYEIIVQTKDKPINSFMDKFKSKDNILGFFVLGGLYSEGIDYVGEMLDGVIIVGVGMPQINEENNLLKSYFDVINNKGFLYSYTYPGFNKIVQAVGRVIRTETDKGIALLIDDRYKSQIYKEIFPAHWSNIKYLNFDSNLDELLLEFWTKK